MLRLTVLLCGGLFLVLLIAGQDHGQLREGLKTPPAVVEKPAVVATAETVEAAPARAEPEPRLIDAVFIPAQPVRTAPATPEPAPEQAVVEVAAPAPQAEVRIAVVSARSVNVRSGPSTSDAIIGRLTSGEQVLVVSETTTDEGWSLVRIEGDGIEGYVASRLLKPQE